VADTTLSYDRCPALALENDGKPCRIYMAGARHLLSSRTAKDAARGPHLEPTDNET
jgi:hypothetical protein